MANDVWLLELLFFDVIVEPFSVAIERFIVELGIVAGTWNIWREDGKIVTQTISNRKQPFMGAAKTMD